MRANPLRTVKAQGTHSDHRKCIMNIQNLQTKNLYTWTDQRQKQSHWLGCCIKTMRSTSEKGISQGILADVYSIIKKYALLVSTHIFHVIHCHHTFQNLNATIIHLSMVVT